MLIGNAGKNPEVRTFNDGNKVASFTLATTKRYADRNGQPMESTVWHNIQASGRAAEVAEKYIQKGDPVYVEGELVTRTYTDQNDQAKTVYEVRASQIQLLGRKEQAQPQPQPQPQPSPAPQPRYQSPVNAGAPANDDLPF